MPIRMWFLESCGVIPEKSVRTVRKEETSQASTFNETFDWCRDVCMLTEWMSKLCEIKRPCTRYLNA